MYHSWEAAQKGRPETGLSGSFNSSLGLSASRWACGSLSTAPVTGLPGNGQCWRGLEGPWEGEMCVVNPRVSGIPVIPACLPPGAAASRAEH